MAELGSLTLADTVQLALARFGSRVFRDSGLFKAYILDHLDPESVELRVLRHACNNRLLEPFAEAADEGRDLRLAAARAEAYLVGECLVEEYAARLVSDGITEGYAHWRGVDFAGDDEDGDSQGGIDNWPITAEGEWADSELLEEGDDERAGGPGFWMLAKKFRYLSAEVFAGIVLVIGGIVLAIAITVRVNTYEIRFVANSVGCTGSTASVTRLGVGEVTLPECGFARDGYLFTGWGIRQGGGELVQPGETFDVSSDTTLYAQWETDTVTLWFFYDVDSEDAEKHLSLKRYDTAHLPQATKDGYELTGWRQRSTGKTYRPNDEVTADEDMNFTASWEQRRFTLTFSGGEGATGKMDPLTCDKGGSVTLPECGFAKKGFVFDCWKEEETDRKLQPGDKVDNVTADHSYVAQWKESWSVKGRFGTWENGVYTSELLGIRVKPIEGVSPPESPNAEESELGDADSTDSHDFLYVMWKQTLAFFKLHEAPEFNNTDLSTVTLNGQRLTEVEFCGQKWWWVREDFEGGGGHYDVYVRQVDGTSACLEVPSFDEGASALDAISSL